ncbi:MAG: excinuclease ABC subunit UvrC [Candidatus Obscuribacterales bacterium]|nr:excinuclease ABC subunit UvrC [Candidatus Obscuribacterales bacterium]
MINKEQKNLLLEQLSKLPDNPGVYIFKNLQDEIIYIGKALNLKSRVRSYWNEMGWSGRPKLAVLVPKITGIETIVTNSEKEALLLEATLVRKHMPRYNVHLKDDKRYPWLCITYEESFPRLIMIRDPLKYKQANPKAKVFGPYVESGLMWETVRVLRKVFPMRQRKKPLFKDRPCMNFHIGLCLGPCQNLVPETFYNQIVQQVELFLSGSQNLALSKLEKEMQLASEALNFEEAAKLRDRLLALRSVLEKQQVFFQDPKVSIDAIAEAHTDRIIALCLIRIREGKLIGSEVFNLPLVEHTGYDEAYQSFTEQYYAESEKVSLPRDVLLQHPIEDLALLQDVLAQKAGRNVYVSVPARGDKLRIMEIAKKNADLALEKEVKDEELSAGILALLTRLQEDLDLSKLPKRIECFDISNIQGSDNVASLVVFENGLAKKSDYRTFKIKGVEGVPNDFASMKEVVGRRFKRLLEEGKKLPDLTIIDGGKGQLNAALEALAELQINDLNIIGLAKKQEEVYKPHQSTPYLLARRSEALHLLQRVRDEAHRFAITFHRKRRAKRSLASGFDQLPGVGNQRRKILLTHFGTFESLKKASVDEIRLVPGISDKIANSIYMHLHPDTPADEDPNDIQGKE